MCGRSCVRACVRVVVVGGWCGCGWVGGWLGGWGGGGGRRGRAAAAAAAIQPAARLRHAAWHCIAPCSKVLQRVCVRAPQYSHARTLATSTCCAFAGYLRRGTSWGPAHFNPPAQALHVHASILPCLRIQVDRWVGGWLACHAKGCGGMGRGAAGSGSAAASHPPLPLSCASPRGHICAHMYPWMRTISSAPLNTTSRQI